MLSIYLKSMRLFLGDGQKNSNAKFWDQNEKQG